MEVEANSPAANNNFDCNICLDIVSNPVVTFCGHLYCWPCIYRWLNYSSGNNSRRCPVCKSRISDSSLVPLYGRGIAGKSRIRGESIGIPGRPRDARSFVAAAGDRQPYRAGVLQSTHEIAFVMLPWAFNDPERLYLSPEMGEVVGENPMWLHQLWVFLLCCGVFGLVLF